MEFSIETKELQKAVRFLGIVSKANAPDFTGRVLIEANENNTILFVANNNSTSITVLSDKANVTTPGSIVILYSKIKTFINSFTPWNDTFGTKEFNFTCPDNEHVTIAVNNVYESGKKSKGKLKIRCYNDGRLQKPAPFVDTHFILNSNMFKKAIGKVVYAIDPNEIRAFIQGMNITFDKDDIYFAGTNGRILSEYKVKNSNELNEKNYVMRYDFIMGLRRAIGEETQIFFEIDGRSIKAKFDNVVFSGKLVIGHDYPNYKEVLENFSKTIMVDKDALISVLAPFMDILDSEDNNRLTLEIKDKKFQVYNDEASFECDFDVDYNGEFIIDMNGRFVFDTVDSIVDDKILIKFTDEKNVLIFDSGTFEDQRALITPIRRR